MKRVGRISRSLAQAWMAGVWFFLVSYFAVHIVQADKRFAELSQIESGLLVEAEEARTHRLALEARVKTLSGSTIDPDMLEEQVRKQLGFAHPDEVILFY